MRSFLGVKTPSWSHMGKQEETLSTNSLSILMTGTMAPHCNISHSKRQLFSSLWRFKNPAKNRRRKNTYVCSEVWHQKKATNNATFVFNLMLARRETRNKKVPARNIIPLAPGYQTAFLSHPVTS